MKVTSKSLIRYLTPAAAAAALALGGVGCKKQQTGADGGELTTIKVKGSDTLVQVALAWAENYGKPNVNVEVAGGGSGTGLTALINGTHEIANASRAIKEKEIKAIKDKYGVDHKEFIVGWDGLAIYVHKDCPIDEISVPELKEIFAEGGTYENWNQLAPGTDRPIKLASRQNNSGTYVFFKKAVCGTSEFKAGAVKLSGSKEVVDLCATTPSAIGYSGMGYKTDAVKWLAVSKEKGAKAYPPSPANVLSGDYPIARPLYLYTVGEPEGAVKEYIDWILSPAGQALVKKEKFVPVNSDT